MTNHRPLSSRRLLTTTVMPLESLTSTLKSSGARGTSAVHTVSTGTSCPRSTMRSTPSVARPDGRMSAGGCGLASSNRCVSLVSLCRGSRVTSRETTSEVDMLLPLLSRPSRISGCSSASSESPPSIETRPPLSGNAIMLARRAEPSSVRAPSAPSSCTSGNAPSWQWGINKDGGREGHFQRTLPYTHGMYGPQRTAATAIATAQSAQQPDPYDPHPYPHPHPHPETLTLALALALALTLKQPAEHSFSSYVGLHRRANTHPPRQQGAWLPERGRRRRSASAW